MYEEELDLQHPLYAVYGYDEKQVSAMNKTFIGDFEGILYFLKREDDLSLDNRPCAWFSQLITTETKN